MLFRIARLLASFYDYKDTLFFQYHALYFYIIWQCGENEWYMSVCFFENRRRCQCCNGAPHTYFSKNGGSPNAVLFFFVTLHWQKIYAYEV